MQAKEKLCSSSQKEHHHNQLQLLPGLPNDITLDKICPKLPWKVFYILTSVSRAWIHAIRSRKVYDARVQSRSTEILVVIRLPGMRRIALWSPRDDSIINFPPLPYQAGRLVSFDGSIYLLGGFKDFYASRCDLSTIDKVYVLDVAGQTRVWKECASMTEPRAHHGCGVMEGKIYVFGGYSIQGSYSKFCGSEVYSPEKDVWSPIKPMHEIYAYRVETVGEELFVLGPGRRLLNEARFLDAYDPVRDEWRAMNRFRRDSEGILFVARGKLHSIDQSTIYRYDVEENSWTQLHSFSFSSVVNQSGSVVVKLSALVAVGDELLGKLSTATHPFEVRLVESRGFGSGQKEIVWLEAPFAGLPKSSNTLFTVLL